MKQWVHVYLAGACSVSLKLWCHLQYDTQDLCCDCTERDLWNGLHQPTDGPLLLAISKFPGYGHAALVYGPGLPSKCSERSVVAGGHKSWQG